MSYSNPLLETIEELKEKELVMPKGANMHPLVKLEDAIDALQKLDVRIWAACEAELMSKHFLNQESY